MNVNKPYSHVAVPWVNDSTGLLECRVCPRPVIGHGPTFRHFDEAVRQRATDPTMADAVEDAVLVVTRALEEMWTDRVSDADRARVAIEALHDVGALQVRRRWKIRRLFRAVA
ncbi:hypothetical protein AB0395_35060 [Streptosporangium sp. NPDC051023]|uniref:hypothetical protein n=1 Tax=Streptosporangium sp. NPDC051023 TaxID=3155410 RepID=UPI0034504599